MMMEPFIWKRFNSFSIVLSLITIFDIVGATTALRVHPIIKSSSTIFKQNPKNDLSPVNGNLDNKTSPPLPKIEYPIIQGNASNKWALLGQKKDGSSWARNTAGPIVQNNEKLSESMSQAKSGLKTTPVNYTKVNDIRPSSTAFESSTKTNSVLESASALPILFSLLKRDARSSTSISTPTTTIKPQATTISSIISSLKTFSLPILNTNNTILTKKPLNMTQMPEPDSRTIQNQFNKLLNTTKMTTTTRKHNFTMTTIASKPPKISTVGDSRATKRSVAKVVSTTLINKPISTSTSKSSHLTNTKTTTVLPKNNKTTTTKKPISKPSTRNTTPITTSKPKSDRSVSTSATPAVTQRKKSASTVTSKGRLSAKETGLTRKSSKLRTTPIYFQKLLSALEAKKILETTTSADLPQYSMSKEDLESNEDTVWKEPVRKRKLPPVTTTTMKTITPPTTTTLAPVKHPNAGTDEDVEKMKKAQADLERDMMISIALGKSGIKRTEESLLGILNREMDDQEIEKILSRDFGTTASVDFDITSLIIQVLDRDGKTTSYHPFDNPTYDEPMFMRSGEDFDADFIIFIQPAFPKGSGHYVVLRKLDGLLDTDAYDYDEELDSNERFFALDDYSGYNGKKEGTGNEMGENGKRKWLINSNKNAQRFEGNFNPREQLRSESLSKPSTKEEEANQPGIVQSGEENYADVRDEDDYPVAAKPEVLPKAEEKSNAPDEAVKLLAESSVDWRNDHFQSKEVIYEAFAINFK